MCPSTPISIYPLLNVYINPQSFRSRTPPRNPLHRTCPISGSWRRRLRAVPPLPPPSEYPYRLQRILPVLPVPRISSCTYSCVVVTAEFISWLESVQRDGERKDPPVSLDAWVTSRKNLGKELEELEAKAWNTYDRIKAEAGNVGVIPYAKAFLRIAALGPTSRKRPRTDDAEDDEPEPSKNKKKPEPPAFVTVIPFALAQSFAQVTQAFTQVVESIENCPQEVRTGLPSLDGIYEAVQHTMTEMIAKTFFAQDGGKLLNRAMVLEIKNTTADIGDQYTELLKGGLVSRWGVVDGVVPAEWEEKKRNEAVESTCKTVENIDRLLAILRFVLSLNK